MEPSHLLTVDAHVHIFDCFDLSRFFEAAYVNSRAEAQRHKTVESFTGMMLLTESSGVHWFQRLADLAKKAEPLPGHPKSTWTIHQTGENCSLLARSKNGHKVIIAAGRQIVTNENLEVSALLTDKIFPDGTPLQETIERIRNNDGVPTLPWSFGKWWGKRGKILSDLLPTLPAKDFFLGDNSHRPGFLPFPIQFKQAEQLGIRMLPGSDPFPFPSEFWRPCSVGFSIARTVRDHCPAEDLKEMLRDPKTAISPYFVPEPFLRFWKNQIAINRMARRT